MPPERDATLGRRRDILVFSVFAGTFCLLLVALLVAAFLDARGAVAAIATGTILVGLTALLGLAAFVFFDRAGR